MRAPLAARPGREGRRASAPAAALRAGALALLAAILPLAPAPVAAQEVAVLGGRWWSSHEELRHPEGLGVRLGVGRVRVEYLHLRARSERTRVVCGGLVPPDGGCPAERATSRASVDALGAGVAVPVLRGRGGGVALVPGVTAGAVRGRVEGVETGNALTSSEWMAGVSLGAEAVTGPVAGLPLRIVVGPRADLLLPLAGEPEVDAHQPFRTEILLARLQVGFLIGRAR